MAAAEPLALAELDAALAEIGGFEPRPFLAVGVSGGPDSVALAILVDRWVRQRGGVAWALVVDHRLRPESGAEAERVVGWLAARGIAHEVLVWDGAKPASGIQEAARAARYRLLGDWCVDHGCLHLLTAHHRDDQVETYLIRQRAKSGVDGLAGMSAVRELSGFRLVRPLLAVPKTRLLALLAAEGQDYVRDPSNSNPVFERSRVRMASLPDRIDATLTALCESAAFRIARERELGVLLGRAVALHPAGFASIDPEAIVAAGELGERALSRVIAAVGGKPYPARRRRVRGLRAALAEASRGRTLGGCGFVPWRGRMLVLRELARTAPPVMLTPGDSALWDRRFLATLPLAAPKAITVGALGTAGLAALGHDPVVEGNPLPRLVYPVLPAIWDEVGLAEVPHLCWRRATMEYAAALAFRPPVSLMSAGFTVV